MCYTLRSWLRRQYVAGWTSLTSIVLLIGSVQLIVLGIIGEYLGRLYIEAKRRPLFVIESIQSHAFATDDGAFDTPKQGQGGSAP